MRRGSRALTASFVFIAACNGSGSGIDAGMDVPNVPDASDAASDASTHRCAPGAPTPPYPSPAILSDGAGVVPSPLAFSSLTDQIDLSSYYQPCATEPRLLVIRSLAAWSGPSRWHASHTSWFRNRPDASRIVVVDLLVLGQSNLPATSRDLAAWLARYDVTPDAVVLDPAYTFRASGARQLPVMTYVDTRTMATMTLPQGPDVDSVDTAIRQGLALLDGQPPPAPTTALPHDGRFTDDQWDLIHEMSPLPHPPPDPSNAHADDPLAAQLGEALFSDRQLSPSGTVACSTCHEPSNHYMDGLATGMGLVRLDRNTPSISLASHSPWQFWDGRADSLWSQALGPIENANEMGSTRLFVAHYVGSQYGTQYASVFGSVPDLSDTTRFPTSGAPGSTAWRMMTVADQSTINRVFSNVGKAIEAYERTLTLGPTPFDAYVAGNADALTADARNGLQEFMQVGCVQCHYGPRLTDDTFHNIGMPSGRQDGLADLGRIDAINTLLGSPFNVNGPFSDVMDVQRYVGLAPDATMLGSFRTPTLRGVSLTGPWGHGGTFTTLHDVMYHYARRGMLPPATTSAGIEDWHLQSFHYDDADLNLLVSFMDALSPGP